MRPIWLGEEAFITASVLYTRAMRRYTTTEFNGDIFRVAEDVDGDSDNSRRCPL
jgi:hypothetical protein